MTAYLDASVVIPLFLSDPFTEQAEELISQRNTIIVSDWAALEISNVVARRFRIKAMSRRAALTAMADFDLWKRQYAVGAETSSADVATATQFVRRLNLSLRSADSLHLAIAQRIGATLITFDARMAEAAKSLGLDVAT